jgi:hypothetical protein
MKKLSFFLVLTLISIFPLSVLSADQAEMEISYLLSFVAESECIFNRNGTDHEAVEASKHLQKKYNYARSRISTSEQFISRIASKSSITRKPYTVRCKGQEIKTGQWLTDALQTYRQSILGHL